MRNQYANLKDQNFDQYIFDVIISGTLELSNFVCLLFRPIRRELCLNFSNFLKIHFLNMGLYAISTELKK